MESKYLCIHGDSWKFFLFFVYFNFAFVSSCAGLGSSEGNYYDRFRIIMQAIY